LVAVVMAREILLWQILLVIDLFLVIITLVTRGALHVI